MECVDTWKCRAMECERVPWSVSVEVAMEVERATSSRHVSACVHSVVDICTLAMPFRPRISEGPASGST